MEINITNNSLINNMSVNDSYGNVVYNSGLNLGTYSYNITGGQWGYGYNAAATIYA